jgi:hypothetical protein
MRKRKKDIPVESMRPIEIPSLVEFPVIWVVVEGKGWVSVTELMKPALRDRSIPPNFPGGMTKGTQEIKKITHLPSMSSNL